MKGNLILLLVLVCFVSVSFSAIKGTNRVVFGVTNGSVISVRDYEILPNGKWDLERILEINPVGPPVAIAATQPNNTGRFQLMYLYDSNQTFKGRNLSIDFDNFQVFKDAPLSGSFGSPSLGVFQIVKNSKNQGRLTFVDSGFDIGTRTIRTGTGNPLKKQLDFFDNDSDYIPVSHSFDWGGQNAAQVLFHPASGDFFGDFQSISNTGRPAGNPVRYRYINDVVNISLGRERLNLSGLTYTVGTRDLKQEGLNLKTSVGLTLFDADLQRPIDNRMVHPFTNISLSNLMPATLTSTVIYDYSDLSYLLYGRQKGGKFQTYLHQFDPSDLSGIRTQVLIGKNDLLLRNSDAAYAFYAVGFYYDDGDDYRK